jgi:flagellar motor switch protein FliN/FliY
MTTTGAPLSWIQQIQEDVSLCKQIPLWGSCPLFPWQALTEALQKTLEIAELKLTASACNLLTPDQFLSSLGAQPYTAFFQMAPLAGTVCLATAAETIEKVTTLLLTKSAINGISDTRLQEGFYQYLLLEVGLQIEKLKTYPDLHIQWMQDEKLPSTPCLTIDISLEIEKEVFLFRLITSTEFHTSFSQHFVKSSQTTLPSNLHNILDALVLLEIGSCSLPSKDWSSLTVGDLLLLDRCSYDPVAESGTAILTFAEKGCFIIKIKKNNLKILDYAVYQGDTHIMDEENLPKEPLDATAHPEDDELPPPEEASPTSPPPEALTSPGNIPFPIVVEVERMKMPLEKLLQLTPGNILELSVKPEQGVYLTIHGRRVARGELIKVGEVLGVKILEIGETRT